jgi:EAL domain-containing protein (putative c-di-GMP-specific phosphodiesterase class I)
MSLRGTHGVKYAVDDFGTDNSNLALLQRFPFDYIKIDRQFTIGAASHGRQLVEGIVLSRNQASPDRRGGRRRGPEHATR